jgi:hypothetical protein
MTNALSWWTLPRLLIVLVFFPYVLVYLAPQHDVIRAFLQGDRGNWFAVWLSAAAFEWSVLWLVLSTYNNNEDRVAIGLKRPSIIFIAMGTLVLLAAIAAMSSWEIVNHLEQLQVPRASK